MGAGPVMNSEGKLDPCLSPWFSYELTRTDWPWIFKKGDKPSLITSTLEALAVLISLKLSFGDEPKMGRTKVQVIWTWTDDCGNRSALNKLMSTKCPSSAVVMELSCSLKQMAAKASVEWAPRSANYDADSFANGIACSFHPSRRTTVDVNALGWEILPKALSMGRQMEEDTEDARASGVSTTPRKETQATQAGGQDESERSGVTVSREGLACALRLTEQMSDCFSWQIAVHGANHASFTLVIANGSKDRAACWESPRNLVALSSSPQYPGQMSTEGENPDSRSRAGNAQEIGDLLNSVVFIATGRTRYSVTRHEMVSLDGKVSEKSVTF